MIALEDVNFRPLQKPEGTRVQAHRLKQVIELFLCGPLKCAFVFYLLQVDQYPRGRDRR